MRDGATGCVLWRVEGHHDWVYRCAFTRDDTLLATASKDKSVKLWRTSDGSLAGTLIGHTNDVSCVACSPVADVLLSGDRDGVVKVWDTATRVDLHTLPQHAMPVTAVAFDARGTLAATGCGDGQIRLFDARARWQPLHTLRAHADGGEVCGLRFSPAVTAGMLASGSEDGTAKLWDVSDARQPLLLHTLSGHSKDVNTVSFSPDGALLATGSDDNTVELWRLADGALLRTVNGHCDWVRSVTFHPRDASLLATCSFDKTLKLWKL
jgi:WD40 repeat protein